MIMSVLFYVGIVAEAMSGAVAAGRYKVDLFGVFFIAFATALGGGSIRDVMITIHFFGLQTLIMSMLWLFLH